MRKVKFKKFIKAEYEEGKIKDYRTRLEGTGCFQSGFESSGFFHCWGMDWEDLEEGVGGFSVGLIEDLEGFMHSVVVKNIKFID